MKNIFNRTELLIGSENLNKLKNSHVAIFGVGGVGGYALEGLVRSGIGKIDVFDNDSISVTNINRQILATTNTVSRKKTEVAKERAKSINKEIEINTFDVFYSAENSDMFDLTKYDYIIDAIDTVSSKIELIINAKNNNIPIISSMGTGNKLEASLLEVADIYKTSVCPLARVMRYELKKRGVKELKCVYSKEQPIKPTIQNEEFGRHVPASIAFVPACAGLIISGEVVKALINND